MNLNEQETQYILQAVMKQPLAEALPIFLKMTQQKLVPDVNKEPSQLLPVGANTTARP